MQEGPPPPYSPLPSHPGVWEQREKEEAGPAAASQPDLEQFDKHCEYPCGTTDQHCHAKLKRTAITHKNAHNCTHIRLITQAALSIFQYFWLSYMNCLRGHQFFKYPVRYYLCTVIRYSSIWKPDGGRICKRHPLVTHNIRTNKRQSETKKIMNDASFYHGTETGSGEYGS